MVCRMRSNATSGIRKKAAKTTREIRMPHQSAMNPVSAVKAKPPMPVAVVIMPVAVAVFCPANGSDSVNEHG